MYMYVHVCTHVYVQHALYIYMYVHIEYVPFHDSQNGHGCVEQELGALQEHGIPHSTAGLAGQRGGKYRQKPLDGEHIGQWRLIRMDTPKVWGVFRGVGFLDNTGGFFL